jgi:hypothetical protein
MRPSQFNPSNRSSRRSSLHFEPASNFGDERASENPLLSSTLANSLSGSGGFGTTDLDSGGGGGGGSYGGGGGYGGNNNNAIERDTDTERETDTSVHSVATLEGPLAEAPKDRSTIGGGCGGGNGGGCSGLLGRQARQQLMTDRASVGSSLMSGSSFGSSTNNRNNNNNNNNNGCGGAGAGGAGGRGMGRAGAREAELRLALEQNPTMLFKMKKVLLSGYGAVAPSGRGYALRADLHAVEVNGEGGGGGGGAGGGSGRTEGQNQNQQQQQQQQQQRGGGAPPSSSSSGGAAAKLETISCHLWKRSKFYSAMRVSSRAWQLTWCTIDSQGFRSSRKDKQNKKKTATKKANSGSGGDDSSSSSSSSSNVRPFNIYEASEVVLLDPQRLTFVLRVGAGAGTEAAAGGAVGGAGGEDGSYELEFQAPSRLILDACLRLLQASITKYSALGDEDRALLYQRAWQEAKPSTGDAANNAGSVVASANAGGGGGGGVAGGAASQSRAGPAASSSLMVRGSDVSSVRSSVMAAEAEAEEEEFESLVEWPHNGSAIGVFFHVVLFPTKALMWLTIPDVRVPKYRNRCVAYVCCMFI